MRRGEEGWDVGGDYLRLILFESRLISRGKESGTMPMCCLCRDPP